MSAMATTLAHELNQPLTAIGNYVAGIRRGLAGPDLSREQLDHGLAAIEKCAFGAGDIIRSIRQMTSENPSERHIIDPSDLIREAAALAKTAPAPRKVKHAPKPAPGMHPEFAAALAKAPAAQAALAGFTPSAQHDYLEWIGEAKQDSTRARRIATAIEWLSEGRRRHWKYESC
jgi:signal transduction histidine kinase